MSEARMREIIRDQVTTSMNEFMANMNRGTGSAGTGGAGTSGAGAGGDGAGGTGAGGDGAGGAGVGGTGPMEAEVTGCTYMTFMKLNVEKDKVKICNRHSQGRALTLVEWREQLRMVVDAAQWCPDKREVTCFNCNKKGHLKKDCPTLRRNGQDGNNRGAVYKLGAVDAQQDPKVVTELGSFDIMIGWIVIKIWMLLSICGTNKRLVSPKSKKLVIEGNRNNSRLKIVSCIKTQKYIEKGCELFLAQVTEQESKEKRLKRFPPVVRGMFPRSCLTQLRRVIEEKGFIRPCSSPWELGGCLWKKKDGYSECIDS
ncbi:putative reverse transcriptase domain-containing protein [Tanacetum coccineum]